MEWKYTMKYQKTGYLFMHGGTAGNMGKSLHDGFWRNQWVGLD